MNDQQKLFGINENYICKECKHCLNAKNYYKRSTDQYHCSRFRDSESDKTRLKGNELACGKFEIKEG